ncbi:hypothetical protein [Limnospira maxima]|uniref:hypothetical protein n=1 Tax=Limnospira maxima TaxID=129910 RepID=UPI00178C6E45|nr:hypothetical protein [Limnospira maxima]
MPKNTYNSDITRMRSPHPRLIYDCDIPRPPETRFLWGKMGMVFSTRCVAMDEKRSQSYLSRIRELLTCANGMELSGRGDYLRHGGKPK